MVSIMTSTNIEGRTEAKLHSSSIVSTSMVQSLEPDCLGSDLHTATEEMVIGRTQETRVQTFAPAVP